MSTTTLPPSAFDGLILKLINILQLSQAPDATTSPQSRQALLHATNDFKETVSRAKELAKELPGGELNLAEQDEIIAMLEQMRDSKRKQLAELSTRTVVTGEATGPKVEVKMEVDSNASTPGQ